MAGFDLSVGTGGSTAAAQGTPKDSAADQHGFDKARGAADKPSPQPPYNQRMATLRKERRELESEKTMLEARTANAGTYPELDKAMRDVKPKLDEVNRKIKENEAKQTALAKGMERNNVDEPGEVCTVKVYTQPALVSGIPGNHSGVLVSDSDGEFYGRAGTPNWPRGKLEAETGRNRSGAKDWDTGPLQTTEVKTFNGDCAPIEDSMKRTAKRINDGDYQYRAIDRPQNCHVGTTEYLGDIGQKVPDNVPGYNPGIGKSLPDAPSDPMPEGAMP